MRTCKHCGGPLPCASCTKAYKQRWADGHKERVRQQKLDYETRHPDRVKAAKQAYYERNKLVCINRAAAHKAADPEVTRQRYRDQYAENPEPFVRRANRRTERDRAVGGEFTQADRCAMFTLQRGMCANPNCEADLSVTGFHADHKTPVALGGSHDPANRQLLCPTCNHRKGAKSNEEWLRSQEQVG